ncbi:MAG: DNA mismatch repair protein MutS [Bacteroidales bacterium]|nr:DNA mismatch repair protein MutS [Bacteroidales bacterium]
MRQYRQFKAKHPDAILLFRVGDFYETFGEDAIKTSEILGITLTRRSNGSASFVELAGFPYHALDTYLPRLVRAGQRVAICEQLEDPKLAKTIVKRGITEMVTPGVSINDNILENRENNFLASVHFDRKMAGVAFLDISTGEFMMAEGSFDYVDKMLNSFSPKEVLYQKGKSAEFTELFGSKFYTFKLDDWVYTFDAAHDRLLRHFGTKTLKGYGVHGLDYGIIAAGAILHYTDLTQHTQLSHISTLMRIPEDRYVWLDRFTTRNLELFSTVNEGAKPLVQILDHTLSPMGARLLKRWIALPLKDRAAINDRLAIVEYFVNNPELRDTLREHIKNVGDLERLISKVAVERINPREVLQLRNALAAIPAIEQLVAESSLPPLTRIAEELAPCETIRKRIEDEIAPDPPAMINRGNVIKNGVSTELDELRNLATSGKDFLVELQERESYRTGIPSLKVAFNNVFGYYIEVRNTYKNRVPKEWTRKQTLTQAERYITQELKEYETKILGAEEKMLAIETQLFTDLVHAMADYILPVQRDAALVAQLDCLLSFAEQAATHNYCKPNVTETRIIDIKQGRHPVIEQLLPVGESYVANDILLDPDKQQIIIITGPNMAGKSALLRQTALITLMAQTGSFVPAASADIGYVDKIFTRVGASDNLSMGESTFMVEMHEAASILNNMSDRSLILLDELGRGTSTYDGISIAWSIVEYIHEHRSAHAKTLFATHYHELNEMAATFSRVKNYNVSIREVDNKVVFLRKLTPGGSNHSFGIHVARMAGMPPSVTKRAEEILKQLEGDARHAANSTGEDALQKPLAGIGTSREGFQLSFFQLDDPVLTSIRDEINTLNINNLTPIEALNKLSEIKKLIGL